MTEAIVICPDCQSPVLAVERCADGEWLVRCQCTELTWPEFIRQKIGKIEGGKDAY